MIIYNPIGLGMTIVAFAIAFGVGAIMGTDAEGPLMMIAGPLLAAMDITYRLRAADRNMFSPDKGGSLFFVPAWSLGVLWFVLGVTYL